MEADHGAVFIGLSFVLSCFCFLGCCLGCCFCWFVFCSVGFGGLLSSFNFVACLFSAREGPGFVYDLLLDVKNVLFNKK